MAGEMKIEMLPIADIIPYGNNPRNNEKAVAAVAASIREYGFKKPILVDEDHVILAGHTRRLAALYLGLTRVPCIVVEDLDEVQKKAYRLADNRVSEFSVWDNDLLKEEMQKAVDVDFSEFGFDIEDPAVAQEEVGVSVHRCPKCGCEFTAKDFD